VGDEMSFKEQRREKQRVPEMMSEILITLPARKSTYLAFSKCIEWIGLSFFIYDVDVEKQNH